MLQAIYRQLGEAVALLVGREAMVQATARDSGPLKDRLAPFFDCLSVMWSA
jgi:hypothetical protein